MKSITVKLNVQPEIINATREFMEEKGLDIEQELSQTVNKLYSKHVPAAVRKYIEKSSSPVSLPPSSLPSETLLAIDQHGHPCE